METTFRQKYNQLEQELSYEFSYLLATAKKEIKFFEGDEFTYEDEEEWANNIYECRSNITGRCYDVFILSAGEDGLYIAEVNDIERQYFIRFSDLASAYDRIYLIEAMQDFLSKQIMNNETKNKFPFQVIIYTGTGDEKFICDSYSTDEFTEKEEAQTLKRMQEENSIFAEIYFDSRDDESYSELYGTIDMD